MSAPDPNPTPANAPPTLTPRKIILQLLGFAIGLALLAWCVRNAIKGGGEQGEGWKNIRNADPLLIAGLIGCTLASLLANGAIFWAVIRPVFPLKLSHMQILNVSTSVLNYAPIRLGLIARIAYHLRVDRMPLLVIGGWFAAIGVTFLVTLAAVFVATLLRAQYDWSWWAWGGILFAELIVGGLVTIAAINLGTVFLTEEFVERIGKGMHRMLRNPAALWTAMGLRLVDIGGFTGRMACAAAILDIGLSASQIVLLGVIAIAASLFPLGRLGWREAGVAFFAQYLGMSGEEFEAARNQLALVESAGEAIVAIPLGAAALLWYRKRWMSRVTQAA